MFPSDYKAHPVAEVERNVARRQQRKKGKKPFGTQSMKESATISVIIPPYIKIATLDREVNQTIN